MSNNAEVDISNIQEVGVESNEEVDMTNKEEIEMSSNEEGTDMSHNKKVGHVTVSDELIGVGQAACLRQCR